MTETADKREFDLDAGALCLDFANTVNWHASSEPEDELGSYDDLVAWAEAAEALDTRQVDRLRQMALQQPRRAQTAFDGAVELREAIYRLFVSASEKGGFQEDDLALLNENLSEALAHLRLSPTAVGFEWSWEESEDFNQVLWAVARSAGELLVSSELDRVSQCADDRGCGYLFVDTSRNHSRRWCSMESCGNRAKAQRHYQRQHEGT